MSGSTTGIMATPEPNRPWYKRWTVVAIGALAAIEALEAQGMVPGALEGLKDFGQILSVVLGSLGVVRHIPTT